MRKELQVIEQIENYLMDQLNPAEKTAFETKMSADANLKSAVEFQESLVEGIQRLGLKNAAQKAYRKYRFRKIVKWVGITAAVVGVILYGLMAFGNREGGWSIGSHPNAEGEVHNEKVQISIPEDDPQSCDANKYLDQELFQLRTDRDTVIESDNGIVIYVPAAAFETDNDQVDFLVQEALTPEDIMYAGLNTMTMEGDTLETGGMFYLDAFVDGERVALKKELLVDIPSNPEKSGMELYDGVKNKEGELLWTNPKPLSKPLIPTEITELDFYPKGYEPKMEEWGYFNKAFKDSLYYSFASECFDEPEAETIMIEDNEELDELNQNNVSTVSPIGMLMPVLQDEYFDQVEVMEEGRDSAVLDDLDHSPCYDCGVNPASVKTIWNAKFNNTNLATKEFEERMPFIHQTCNNSILELYINNLDKDLSSVDALAAKRLGGSLRTQFEAFAGRNDGKVEVSTAAQQTLNAYYQKKRLALQRAIELTNANYWNEQRRLDREATEKRNNAVSNNMAAKAQLNREELDFNTDKVYADLGMKKPDRSRSNPVVFNGARFGNGEPPQDYTSDFVVAPLPPARAQRSVLRGRVNNLGWKNVDCIYSVTTNRNNVKIKGNRRTTALTFSDLSVMIGASEEYQSVNVYVVPNELNSYVKLKPTNGAYNYRLNDNLTYRLVVLAWNESGFFHHLGTAEEGKQQVELETTSRSEWEKKVKANLAAVNNLGQEIDYLESAKRDFKRKNEFKAKSALREKVRPYVFPCACDEGKVVEISDSLDISILNTLQNNQEYTVTTFGSPQVEPGFPGGQDAMANFVSENFEIPGDFRKVFEGGVIHVSFIG